MKKFWKPPFQLNEKAKKLILTMKLTVFILFLTLMQVSATVYSQATKFSFRAENKQVVEVLRQIEENSNFRFFFLREQVDVERKVTVTAREATVEQILDELFRGQPVSYEFANEALIVLTRSDNPLGSVSGYLQGKMQQPAVSGTVTDESGQPLPGVTVVVKGTTQGTVTNAEGNYSLSNIPEDGTLVFSFMGMQTQEVVVGSQNSINVVMEEDVIGIEEVVAIGYGTMKRSDLTGSISSVKGDELIKTPVASINQALVGKVPGVRVSSESGTPGAGVTIRIRGMNSIQGNNDPLYVIDGIPLSVDISGGGDNTRNPLASINPNDIETIEILKDASATAIYGSRGANGVVLITTKTGKTGKSVISFDSYYAVQSEINRYDVLNAIEFAEYRNEAVANAGNPAGAVVYSPQEVEEFRNGGGTNWHDELIRNAPMQNFQLSIAGGSEKTIYYLSGNYFKQNGIIKASGFNRKSIKSNIHSEISDKLNVGLNILFSQSQFSGNFGNSANNSYRGGYIDIYYAPPTFPVKDSDGTYFDVNPLSAYAFPNPVENAMAIISDQTNLSFHGNVFGEYLFTPSLKLKVTFGNEVSSDNIRQYLPNYTQNSNYKGRGSQSHGLARSYLNVNTLTYDKKINEKHGLNIMIGNEIQSLKNEGFGGISQSYVNNTTGYYSLQSGAEITSLSSSYSSWSLLSYIGRINYVFDDKYLLTLTSRMDGSSKFQKDNKWGFFPSAAVAWRAVNEKFIRDLNVFSNLKLRASLGNTGSQAISPYRTLDLISVTNQITVDGNNTTLGYYPNRISSPNLKWETTSQLDVGIDFGFLNNKISITADYFYKKTTDLLLDVTIPSTTGFSSQLQNKGAMENQGTEISFTSMNVQNKSFQWKTSFNTSFLKNKVLDLGGQDFIINSPQITRSFGTGTDYAIGITKVGEPFGSFYVLQEDGIIDNTEELNQAPSYPGMKIGDRKYIDVNGDNAITADDRELSGNAQPKFIGGLTNEIQYKGFDVNLFFEWSYGNKIFNATKYTLERPDGEFNTTKDFYNNRWTGDGSSSTYPQVRYNTINIGPSDSYVEDGSYLRLKNITLGYSFNNHLLERLKLKTLRLYVTGTNLLTFTDYKGIDPDVNVFGGNDYGVGIDYSGYPTTKTYTLGLNVQF